MSLPARPWCPNGSDWTGLCYNQDKVLLESTYPQEVRCCKTPPCPVPQAPPVFSSHSTTDEISFPWSCGKWFSCFRIFFRWEVWIHSVCLLETSFTCISWVEGARSKLSLRRKSTFFHISYYVAGEISSSDHHNVIFLRARNSFNPISER